MPFSVQTDNPLAKYFREPGLYVRLPSCGFFYEEGVVDFTQTKEVAVMPMTAYDELILKSPDALFNGDAVEKVMRSCVPAVAAPRKLCVQDVDVIMLAVRGASSGDDFTIDVKCPECSEESRYTLSIRYLLETISLHDPQYPVRIRDNVTVYMRPQSYGEATQIAVETFEQMKVIQQLRNEKDEAEKRRAYDEAFERLCASNISSLTNQIAHIEVPEGHVTDRDHIHEFLLNTDSKSADKLQEKSREMAERGLPQQVEVECSHCGHKWQTKMAYDPSYFFG